MKCGTPSYSENINLFNNNFLKQLTMQISHIEHVGIAVTSLEEAIPFYENLLGFKCFAIEEVEDQHVKTAFFNDRFGQEGPRGG